MKVLSSSSSEVDSELSLIRIRTTLDSVSDAGAADGLSKKLNCIRRESHNLMEVMVKLVKIAHLVCLMGNG